MKIDYTDRRNHHIDCLFAMKLGPCDSNCEARGLAGPFTEPVPEAPKPLSVRMFEEGCHTKERVLEVSQLEQLAELNQRSLIKKTEDKAKLRAALERIVAEADLLRRLVDSDSVFTKNSDGDDAAQAVYDAVHFARATLLEIETE